jgi:4-alpha-glucanotransferase
VPVESPAPSDASRTGAPPALAPTRRRSGILLHPTSLAGPPGIGDLGAAAHRFLETLAAAEQSLWQVLPLGPTSFGDSPYTSSSTFAGNPLLLSPAFLVEDGLLPSDAPARVPPGPPGRVDFAAVIPPKRDLLSAACDAFRRGEGSADLSRGLAEFRERESAWLPDYAAFAAIHEEQGREWTAWPAPLRDREPAALAAARDRLAGAIDRIERTQFLFDRQMDRLCAKARDLGIGLFGDLPVFAAADSADVWANRDLFDLDERGLPLHLSGAPPDAFTSDGQLWGTPLYRWDVLEERGFDWWIARVRVLLRRFDLIRLDHFRGFAACWTVPAGETTARNGRWEPVPGDRLFAALREALGPLPFVAEDLGDITPDVVAMRQRLGFPGMKVLLFGFGGDPKTNEHATHAIERDFVVYTGTHDNETAQGWFRDDETTPAARPREAAEQERHRVRVLTGSDGASIHWDLVRLAMASPAETAILSAPDLLGLGNEARMNVPGRHGGNWTWRLRDGEWTDSLTGRLAELTRASGRAPGREKSS